MSTPPTLLGTYTAPAVRKGERVNCLYRDADCVVTGFTDAPIPWPRVRALEHRGGSGLWVCAELERAIRTESALALMHWFGVSVAVAWKWRKLFGVNGHTKTRGSRTLQKATAEKGAAATQAREWTPAERDAYSRRSKRLRLKPPNPARVWTAAEEALLGTDRDEVIAERINRSVGAVEARRHLLEVRASGSARSWTAAEVALLGTDTDAAVAEKIGRTRSAVSQKRLALGVGARRAAGNGAHRG